MVNELKIITLKNNILEIDDHDNLVREKDALEYARQKQLEVINRIIAQWESPEPLFHEFIYIIKRKVEKEMK